MKKITALLMAIMMGLTFTACSTEAVTDTEEAVVITDREGNDFEIPAEVETIICVSSTILETLIDLGLGDKIVGIDTYSVGIDGVSEDVVAFDMMAIDTEAIIALDADIIFATGMSYTSSEEDPYSDVKAAGTIVTMIPSATSIDDIKEDIEFIGAVTGTSETAEEIIEEMTSKIEEITSDLEETGLSVYFEISASPYQYSFNDSTFMGAMIIELGCTNIFGDEEYEWFSPSEEQIIAGNPDIIFTTVDYIDEPVEEIKSRDGWDVISAVANDNVYYIDTNSSNRANENIVIALEEMATAIKDAAN